MFQQIVKIAHSKLRNFRKTYFSRQKALYLSYILPKHRKAYMTIGCKVAPYSRSELQCIHCVYTVYTHYTLPTAAIYPGNKKQQLRTHLKRFQIMGKSDCHKLTTNRGCSVQVLPHFLHLFDQLGKPIRWHFEGKNTVNI